MIKITLVLISALSLSACSLTPKLTAAKPNFPAPYVDEKTNAMPVCDDLKQIPPDVHNLSSIFKIVAENYTNYWQCSNKVDGWKNWYEVQKRNYESK